MSEHDIFSIGNPELKAKLERLHINGENKDLEEEILDEIANRTQFLSVVHPAEDSTPEAPKFDFPMLTTSGHGYIFYPIFTDMEELRKWNQEEDVQIVVLTFDNYAEMVAQNSKVHGLAVNPYGANFSMDRDMVDYLQVHKTFMGKLAIEQMFQQQNADEGGVKLSDPDPYPTFSMDRDMVDYLQVHKTFMGKLAIEQMFQQQNADEGGVKLSDPDPYPTEMVEATAAYMATNSTIRRAWLRLMESEGEQSYLVIIDAEDSDTHGDFGMVEATAAYMATNSTIRRAWLRLMESEGEQSYLVIIDAEDSDTHGDFGEVSSAALPYLKDCYLDLMTLEDDFSKKAVEGVAPFYEK